MQTGIIYICLVIRSYSVVPVLGTSRTSTFYLSRIIILLSSKLGLELKLRIKNFK